MVILHHSRQLGLVFRDDLNVPGAIGDVFSLLNQQKPSAMSEEEAARSGWDYISFWTLSGSFFHQSRGEEHLDIPAEIQALAEKRWLAKTARDWAAADLMRQELDAAGWVVKDAKDSFQLLPK
jgi:cysteinyl-tRNA synthetase